MSNDIFLICARKDGPATFKRALAEEIMNRGAINPRLPLTDITYSDGGAEVSIEEDEDIDGGGFGRFGGRTFYDRLWELADRTGSYLVWPDFPPCLAVTRPEFVAYIDEDTVEAHGPPYVVKSGKELEYAIEFDFDANEPPDDEDGEESA